MSEYNATIEEIRKMPVKEAIMHLCNGNPGGLNVLMMCVTNTQYTKRTIPHILDLDLRGSDLWVVYKDLAKGDLETFAKMLEEKDPNVIAYINENRGHEKRKPLAEAPNFAKDLREL